MTPDDLFTYAVVTVAACVGGLGFFGWLLLAKETIAKTLGPVRTKMRSIRIRLKK